MSSHVFGARARRFAIAFTLFTIGQMALPGGPFDADHLQTLSRAFQQAFRGNNREAAVPTTVESARAHDQPGAGNNVVVVAVTGVR